MEKKSSSREIEEPERKGLEENEEEYVLLDLESISNHIGIPPNAPYVLSVIFRPLILNILCILS